MDNSCQLSSGTLGAQNAMLSQGLSLEIGTSLSPWSSVSGTHLASKGLLLNVLMSWHCLALEVTKAFAVVK